MATAVETRFPAEAKLSELASRVYDADHAWYENLDDPALKAAYKEAKKAFRDYETKALNAGACGACHRCGGAGGWEGWPGYTCFECGGSGKGPLKKTRFPAEPTTRAKKEAAWTAEVDRLTAAYEAALTALGPLGDVLRDARAEVAKWHVDYEQSPDPVKEPTRDTFFRASLADTLYKRGALSDAQLGALKKGVEREKATAEEQAAAGPLAEGSYEVVGEVVSEKWVDGMYGSTHKMLVKLDNGNKVWGSVPAKVEDACRGHHDQETGEWVDSERELVGARVKFTAFVERSRDDEHFGFFKRPKQAEVL